MQGSLSASHREDRQADRIQPEKVSVSRFGNVRGEEAKHRNERTGDQVGWLADPEHRQPQQHVPQAPPADARDGTQHDETDDVHLLARGNQNARHGEGDDPEPIEGSHRDVKHGASPCSQP
jgi:hypothetical protein